MAIKLNYYFITTILLSILPLHWLMFNTSLDTKIENHSYNSSIPHKNVANNVTFFGNNRIFNQKKYIQNWSELKNTPHWKWDNYQLKTIVIDAGHGGKDDGASAPNGKKEKDIALIIAKKLGTYITSNYPSIKVIYTRKTDVFVELHDRAKIANDNNADLFISIHCNSFKKTSVKGAETYVLGLHRNDENMEVIKRENDVVKLEENYQENYEEYGVDKSSPLYEILMNSYQNAYLEQSLNFAQYLDTRIKNGEMTTRGVHQAGFVVLSRTAMPSVLVETGYLSNTEDLSYLTSEDGQNDMAYRIYSAFYDYKISIEKETKTKEPKTVEVKTIENPNHIEFGLQLASVENAINLEEEKWAALKDRLIIEKSSDGLMRYIIKDYGIDFEKAKSEKSTFRNKGFVGCFLIAYKNGQRVELYRAKKELGL